MSSGPNAPSPTSETVSAAKTQKVQGVCDLLDFVTIVSAALLLLFVVFWLAGVLNGTNSVVADLPQWLKDTYKAGKGAVSAAGATAVLQLLRARLNRGTGPQYVFWVLLMFFVLGGSAIGLSKILKPVAASAIPADLFFNPDFAAGTEIEFVSYYHQVQHVEDLVRQPKEVIDPPSYEAHVFLPGDKESQYEAGFRPKEVESQNNAPGTAVGYYFFCIETSPAASRNLSRIILSCANFTCSVDRSNESGLAQDCSTGRTRNAFPGILQWLLPAPVEAAGDHLLPSDRPFWTVPFLSTLQKMNNAKRIGFTQFDIALQPSAALSGADTYQFGIVVNGEPIYFNGFPPELLRDKFVPGSLLHFSFGLENLNFSGADRGFEDLSLKLTFLAGSSQVASATVTRQYAALRDAPAQTFSTGVGSLTWSGKYRVPPQENKYEVLVNSTPNVNEAMQLKARLGRLQLTIDSKPAVLVVRPPLRTPPYYGEAIGIVQPTGQVQFTFDQNEARTVCSWAREHIQQTRILRSDMRRYEVATRQYAPCN